MIQMFSVTNLRNLQAIKLGHYRHYAVATTNKTESVPKEWQNAKTYESIPGPCRLETLGNLCRIFTGTSWVQIVKEMHERYGEIVNLRNLHAQGDMTFLFDTKDIEFYFRNEGAWPIRDILRSNYYYRHVLRKDIFGDTYGLINGQNEDWAKFRTKVNPIMLQPRVMHQYIPLINKIADEFIENVKKLMADHTGGEMPNNFNDEIHKFTFETIAAIALDVRIGVLSQNPTERALNAMKYVLELIDMLYRLDVLPLGRLHMKYNTPLWKRYLECQDFFSNMCLDLVEMTKERIESDPYYALKPEHKKSIFEKLVAIDKKVAMVTTLDLIKAGVDTTGKSIGAILYFLAKSPSSQDILRKELKGLLPSKNAQVSQEMLEDAKYLRAVIKESLRLSPVAAGIQRRLAKPMVLGGYQLPEGTLINMPNLYLSSQTEKYFKNPHEFIPERWQREENTCKMHPFANLPFGFGTRSCVGRRIAAMEMEIVVAKLIRNFAFEWHHKDITFKLGFLHGTADPLKFKVTEIDE